LHRLKERYKFFFPYYLGKHKWFRQILCKRMLT
jgi:hypothetical protein